MDLPPGDEYFYFFISCSFLLSSIQHRYTNTIKERLNTQRPAVIKSTVLGLFSPAAWLSTADTHWGWPILHYGLSEKESIAASWAVESAWPPSGSCVRHQSQEDTQEKKSWAAKLERGKRKRVLQNADRDDVQLAVFWWHHRKRSFIARRRDMKREKETRVSDFKLPGSSGVVEITPSISIWAEGGKIFHCGTKRFKNCAAFPSNVH